MLERVLKIIFTVFLVGSLIGCQQELTQDSTEITVSAAASLTDALNDVAEAFNTEHENITVNYNFGGSGALAQQIAQGAPVDVFISAAENHFEHTIEAGYIDSHITDAAFLSNDIVLVANENSNLNGFENLTSVNQISIGNPETVPAGAYGKEVLEYYNIFDSLKSNIIYAEDVRQVLTYVESGSVDAGLVYHTDALTSDQVKIIEVASDDSHAFIEYFRGVIRQSKDNENAQLFYDFLTSSEANEIFESYGFTVQ